MISDETVKKVSEITNISESRTKYGLEKQSQNEKQYLTDEQFLKILQRFKFWVAIQPKDMLGFIYDDNTPGDRSLSSDIGLCNSNAGLWRKSECDLKQRIEIHYIYPKKHPTRFEKYGIKSKRNYQSCPFKLPRKKGDINLEGSGCFWFCEMRKRVYSKQEALKKYDQRISEIKEIIKIKEGI